MDPLAIVTAAIQSTRSLKDTVNRFKDRNKTLARLQHEVEDLSNILNVLKEAVDSGMSMAALVEGPVSRCNQVCREFENAMQDFSGKSKIGIRDWTRMEFMRGDINEFMDTLAGYKSTISVGIGTITMQTSKLSHQVLEEYSEMIQDTAYNLNIHLQRIDEKMALFTAESREIASASATSIDLEDERVVTEQCLRICEDARSYIESLTNREESLKHPPLPMSVDNSQKQFEAQLLARKALDDNRDSLSQTIGRLRERLEVLTTSGTLENDCEVLRLQEHLETSKQCLEVCKMASDEVAHRKIYSVGELTADGDSDQVLITTLADLFEVRKASSTNGSAQWIGSMNDETVRQVSSDRYSSRFGALVTSEISNNPSPSTSDTRGVNSSPTRRAGKDGQPIALDAVRRRPSPNEMRKRAAEDDSTKEERR
ncbi:hypothetical protein B0J13DRAFT_596078 [Dactylonectria estremocensis]|uniref:Azaphilone pigments biosynthesis cluster protein L N-terminal domain-containing protein n=1 Tax=Dactylonectria estremocensis TaxID=1079267 RepID=A0A9P9J3Z9_9HYPO|nr:hypothetical protein B0J13DRAFT_596078 [Dactylonectria estremocensis]